MDENDNAQPELNPNWGLGPREPIPKVWLGRNVISGAGHSVRNTDKRPGRPDRSSGQSTYSGVATRSGGPG